MSEFVKRLFYRLPHNEHIMSVCIYEDGVYYAEIISLETHVVECSEHSRDSLEDLYELLYEHCGNAGYYSYRDALKEIIDHAKEALKCQK